MIEVDKNLENSDLEIEFLKDHNLLEVRIRGELRKSIRKNRHCLDEILPKDFIIKVEGREEFKVKKSIFNAAGGWKVRFETSFFNPQNIESNIEGHSITLVIAPVVMGYVYWDDKVGNILSVGPEKRSGMRDASLIEVPMEELVEMLSGERDIRDYYITFSKEDLATPIIKRRPAVKALQYTDKTPYQFFFNPLNKVLEVNFRTNLTEPLTFYITKAGDPTYIIEKLTFRGAEVDKQLIPIKTTLREISIYIQTNDDVFTPVPYSLAQERFLYEIPRNYPDPELLIELVDGNLTITLARVEDLDNFIAGGNKDVVYHGQKGIILYVTPRGNPFYLIKEIAIPFGQLMVAEDRVITVGIDTREDISIYTNPIFETYSLKVR